MKILHYALGFPPYRTGGLTKYCTDLMLTQKEEGHDVALLWPGEIRIIHKNTIIRERESWNGIASFEIINPLPVPLDEGITDKDAYTKAVDVGIYENFLKVYKPDVLHIHSLMGLHKELILAAHKQGIRSVFTSHDYFGICPKATLYHDGAVCDNDHNCADCVRCNQTALSLKNIAVLQSPLYRRCKDMSIVKAMRNRHRQVFFDENAEKKNEVTDTEKDAADYRKLRQYYVSMLELMDMIHFNSCLSEKVYKKYIHPKNSIVVPIAHRDIKEHRRLKDFHHEKLRIAYLGPAKPFKGFQFLIGVLDKIWHDGMKNFELHLYVNTEMTRQYITHMQNGYTYSQLEGIFNDTDLLVVPSQWYETFGFTVLEALSYGVPVVVTEKVGASDLLKDNSIGAICNNEELYDCIRRLCINREQLAAWNKGISKLSFSTISDVNQCYN